MKITNDYEMSKTDEDFRTALESVLTMPPKARIEYLSTPEGAFMAKGLLLEAENRKKFNPKTNLSWNPEDIERLNEALINASPEDFEVLVSLVPGSVLSVLKARGLKKSVDEPKNYHKFVSKLKNKN